MAEPLLDVRNLKKTFGSVMAVDDVSFSLGDTDEITALIGPNGAGKTTTYDLLTGKLRPTEGGIRFQGTDITDESTEERTALGLGRSFQITNIFEGASVRENIRIPVTARSDRRFRPFERIEDVDDITSETDRILDLMGLRGIENETAENLSHGQKRRVEIGITIATGADLVLLDEPTAGMNPEETNEMVGLITDVNAAADTTFFLTEHNMNVVFAAASRILVLDRGSLIADGSPEEVQRNEQVQRAYLGSETADRDAGLRTGRTRQVERDEPLLEVEDIHTYYGESHVLGGLSLDVYDGEAVALLGRNGAGKTTTLRSIVGTTPPRSGAVRLNGDRIDTNPPYRIAERNVGYVPEDRRVFTSLSVRDNITLRQAENPEWTLERIYEVFPVLEEYETKRANQLSGGEQQMLAVARALATDPELLLLDEPTEGLAPVIVDNLRETIHDIIDGGVTVLLTEQNIAFALSLADRNYIIDNGVVRWNGTTGRLLEDRETIERYISLEDVQT